MARNNNSDGIKALTNKGFTQLANGKDTTATDHDLAAEMRKAGHHDVADALERR